MSILNLSPTDPAYHRNALLLTLLTRAQAELAVIASTADAHYDQPGAPEVLGQSVRVGRTLREMERLLNEALAV